MKHNIKITLILLGMFVLTQFIGLYVVNYYSPVRVIDGVVQNVSAPGLPYGMQTPEITQESEFYALLPSIVIAFIIAILLVIFLSKFKIDFVLKAWFFLVIIIALGIAINSFIPSFKYSAWIVLIIALPLAFFKIYRQNFFVHNLTELLVYPGIAAVFVPILNLLTAIILLILISVYDMWAVWHSGIMQKMAKYHINNLKIFPGFFVPYIGKGVKDKLKKLKKSQLKKKKIKVNVAILGGGDVIFPIIAAGVVLKTLGLLPALFVTAGATLGLGYLFFFAEKKKFYPAMPFITAGIFLGMILGWLIL